MTEEKLPLKSVNNRKCITKCFPKRTPYVHPILLTGVWDIAKDSCAVTPVTSKDPRHKHEYKMVLTDVCKLEDNEKYKQPDELENILLSFHFSPRDFLTNIYSLDSFDNVIAWTIENDNLPFATIKRVHDCAWKIYGEELSVNVLEFYYKISKIHWMKDYVKIIQNDYSFDLVSKSSKITDNFDEILNILRTKYYTYDFFVNSMKKYISEHGKNWETIDSYYDSIKKFLLQQLILSIEKDGTQ